MQNKKTSDLNNFDSIVLKLASPEKIKEWSFGEVTKPETINYRTQRSEKSGLFDEKIFGPDKDYECYCGKYRGIRYKGIVCEKCGVEITRSIVRRERMGHIELAAPVSHIWFLRSLPSRISMILGIPAGDVEKVVYFAGYIVTRVFDQEKERILKDLDSEYKTKMKSLNKDEDKEKLKELFLGTKKEIESIQEGVVLDEVAYHNFGMKYSTMFEAGIGAEAIYNIFKNLDLQTLATTLEAALEKSNNIDAEKIKRRLSVVQGMINADVRPEWMFLTRIPVIPPALRPMVALDGGRYATSDVNDLYRRVINRNNRLKKLKDIKAPDVILRNEKRILQEAVDALLDNSIRHGNSAPANSLAQRRSLKSLADNLKGKRGLLRGNLLGKRVDYSGRSVIVVGPTLNLDQCGLPKHMALELFKPFVIAELLKKELAYNIRGAGKLIDEGIPEVWAILEDVIADKYVLLNRAPTLHRLSIQAFRPVLIEGNAIHVHPLVCTAFNADFDGDQMAVHVPLSMEAQAEAREIMASDKNVLKPGSGDPIIAAKMLDIILGCYWMTRILPGEKGEGKLFAEPRNAVLARDYGELSFRANIKLLAPKTPKFKEFEGKIFETSVGRILFNELLPDDYPYQNNDIVRKTMAALIDDLTDRYGIEGLPPILDKIKAFGFNYATASGTTWGIDDVVIPEGREEILDKSKAKASEVRGQFEAGLLSEDERIRKNIEIWHAAKGEVEKLIPATLGENGSVHDMVVSGARGSISQITQMAGIKGLIQNTAGETIELPILSCSKEGLTPIEYFISTHGSRKGMADTALNTARAGYLTRRLFDVSQDVVVTEDDCGTKEGTLLKKEGASGIDIPISKIIKGRFLAQDVVDSSGKVLFKKGHFVNKHDAMEIEKAGIGEVWARSPLSCKTLRGVCVKCYGADLGKGRIVELGEAVGTVAAQSIGEPGTQLTMRTFHAGGTASVGGDITAGLPRAEEVFEKRKPKNPAVISHIDGTISEVKQVGREKVISVIPDISSKKSKDNVEYTAHYHRTVLVKAGDVVKKGDFLTDGSANIDELFKFAGKEKTENYIIREISKLYELQGESVSRKHIEIIIKQMFSRRKITDVGGSALSRGDVLEAFELAKVNEEMAALGKEEVKAESLVMGIAEVSLSRKSVLSAASFQHTTRVLISSALRGFKDNLVGLKENVIIGRLIPAGTGFKGSSKNKLIEEVRSKAEANYNFEEEGQSAE